MESDHGWTVRLSGFGHVRLLSVLAVCEMPVGKNRRPPPSLTRSSLWRKASPNKQPFTADPGYPNPPFFGGRIEPLPEIANRFGLFRNQLLQGHCFAGRLIQPIGVPDRFIATVAPPVAPVSGNTRWNSDGSIK